MTTSRSLVPARAAQAAHERWARVAVAAAKQCGRAVLPRIADVRTLAAVLALPDDVACRLWLTEPAVAAAASADVPDPPVKTCLAIGPEGGWTDEEVRAAIEAGWRPWSLAPVTLRAEHVALAALAVVRYAWDAGSRRRIT